jgi:AbrB family looped-hinge helix DNA binding protein
MAVTTISSKFQIVIPKEVRERLRLRTGQRLHVIDKGGVITLVPEVPPRSLKGFAAGVDASGLREKKDRL